MTSPNELTWMQLTAGPDTQPDHQAYAGRIIGVPPGTDVGSGPTAPGRILGVYGYPVANPPGSPVPMNWVMTSSLPGAAKDYIHNIPDTGWLDTDSEEVYRSMARALIEFPVPMAQVGELLTALWTAAVLNERAAVQATG
jgi:hypothetical protein